MMRLEEKKNENSEYDGPPLSSQPQPWLVICPSRKTQTFYSISEDQSHERSIHELGNAIIRAYVDEWLVLEDYDSTDCHLWNLISNHKIQLPPLPYNNNLKCLLSAPPNDPECRVLFLIHETTTSDDDDTNGDENSNNDTDDDENSNNDTDDENSNDDTDTSDEDTDTSDDDTDSNDDDTESDDDETPPALYFCKPGYDQEFHKQDLKSVIGDNSFWVWTVFKGKFYVLTWQTRILLRLDVDDSSGTISATPMTNQPPYDYFFREFLDMPRSVSYLIQSSSRDNNDEVELLYVQILFYGRDLDDVYKITVFRFDFVNKVWQEVKSIGETAIFLGAAFGGTTCSTRGTNLKKQSVYLTRGRYLYIFNLETQSISVSLPCPHISIMYPRSYWLTLKAA